VGNIHFNVTEADLTEIFVPFGKLEMVQLMREDMEGSRSKAIEMMGKKPCSYH
jgi:RNA-binding protein 39